MQFIFNRIFTETSAQQIIFEEIYPSLESALDCEKESIFAFGQTGSGKTYTMLGANGYPISINDSLSDSCGILPKAAEFFKAKEARKKNGYKITIKFSAIEIYNETIEICVIGTSEVSIKGLCIRTINTQSELPGIVKCVLKICQQGKQTKTINPSSRSHCIMQFIIESTFQGKSKLGLLNIVDLAGPERANKVTMANKSKEERADEESTNRSK